MSSYWESFWSNFLSSLLVLFIASLLLPWAFSSRDMPSVYLANPKTRRNRFEFTRSTDDEWQTTVDLRVVNRGRKTLNRYYWELFIPKGVNYHMDRVVDYEEKMPLVKETFDRYVRLTGFMEAPIFTIDTIHFPYAVKIKQKERHPVRIYYRFRTEYGESPFWSWIAIATKKLWLIRYIEVA